MKNIFTILILTFSFNALSQEKEAGRKYKAVTFAYTTSYSFDAPSLIYSGALNGTGSFEGTISDAISFGLEYGELDKNKDGWNVGFQYDFQTGLKEYTFTDSGGTQTVVTNTSAKYNTMLVYFNGIKDFGSFYLTGGANYTLFPVFKPSSGSATASGGFGYQLGLGYWINEKWAADFHYRSTSADITEVSGGTTWEYQLVTFKAIQVNFKYLY